MTKSWTDERLEERFDRIDQRFDAADRQFERVDAGIRDLRGEMSARFDKVDARFDLLQRTMLQFGGALIVALVAGFVGIATQI